MREPASYDPSDLVIHVPHASLVIPDDLRGQFVLSDAELEDEARTSADLHTDALAAAAWPGAMIISAPVSRLVIDVERFADDAAEPMAAVGRGMVYDRTHDGRPLRRRLSRREREELKARYYDPHWTSLRSAAGGKVLIDLHSYPVRAWPVEPVQTAERPEIDLGVVDGLTPSRWVQVAQEHFQRHGYSVGVNTPYAGVIDAGARAAMMIEIRRDVLLSPAAGAVWRRICAACAALPVPDLCADTGPGADRAASRQFI